MLPVNDPCDVQVPDACWLSVHFQLLLVLLLCAGGDVKKLDFRFFAGNKKIGAPFHGLKAFFTTGQLNVLDKVITEAALFECLLEATVPAFHSSCFYFVLFCVCNCFVGCCQHGCTVCMWHLSALTLPVHCHPSLRHTCNHCSFTVLCYGT